MPRLLREKVTRQRSRPSIRDGAAQAVERKIITNWYLSIKVDDFDVAFSAVEEMAKAYGGYVVSGYTYNDDYNQQGYISIRVDAELVDAAVEALKTLGTVEDSNFTTNDITMEYYDLQSRLTQYRAQEARLLELYDQAENIEDLLAIETELVRIQSEIDSLEGTIRYYDQLTTLSLIEVSLYSPRCVCADRRAQRLGSLWQESERGLFERDQPIAGCLGSLCGLAGRRLAGPGIAGRSHRCSRAFGNPA